MTYTLKLWIILAIGALPGLASAACPDWLDVDINRLRSTETVNLCDLQDGHPMLIVNTASFCGYTGQFRGLEALYKRYRDQGFTIVGVPSNDFRQEASNEAKTAEICFVDYGVTFPMTAPQSVTGPEAHPLFRKLAEKSGAAPGWNFNKYLIDPQGNEVWHYPSRVAPDDPELTSRIKALLE
ncbi:glutathione peroxidase [Marinobacter mangrovi]|uniref:glutathione peroxidase n=1 Tax=Marinobacter mangrovi TaxID=2803918 RepID=UPI00193382C7